MLARIGKARFPFWHRDQYRDNPLLTVLVKVWEQFFSDSATLARLKQRQADIQGRIHAESASLRRDYLRIEAQPDLSGRDNP